jgi:hypothetical protein
VIVPQTIGENDLTAYISSASRPSVIVGRRSHAEECRLEGPEGPLVGQGHRSWNGADIFYAHPSLELVAGYKVR